MWLLVFMMTIAVDCRLLVEAYLSNHADVLTEARWEALSRVLVIGEVVTSTGVEVQLQLLQKESQLQSVRVVR